MKKISNALIVVFLMSALYGISKVHAVEPAMPAMAEYSASPIFISATAPPMVMLVMGRDHKLYYEAYNDASDLDGDGIIDVGYNPNINYYGYFDSYRCYVYSTSNNRFEPSSPTTTNKTCSGKWSGDFLNYVTMSRMDTMRKVLYGGYRSTDTATETVLERTFIPQDAHSWGKEYKSIEKDGYNIRDYTPLDPPATGTRHLFANTTLSTNGPPLMRVLNDSIYRIWEWVAKERPVAGDSCGSGTSCATSGGASWEIVPASAFESLTQTTYNISGISTHPNNHAEFNTLQTTYGIPEKRFGSGSVPNINGSGNPFGLDDYYMTIFEGKINIPVNGMYEFAVDGDDAVELKINGTVVVGWYGGHGSCNTCLESHKESVYLAEGQHDIVFRHEEMTGGDNYFLYWKRIIPSSTITDYHVRVQVGVDLMVEPNCKQYGGENGPYKPVGLLQKHGETDKMYFGLMTGSYAKNMSGGVLRKNISSIKDEINVDTGQFINDVNGIIQTINKFRISDFRYASKDYAGGWEVGKPMSESSNKFPDWGNPIAEMMYETLCYFADGKTPTEDYNYSGTTVVDSTLGLPKVAWNDPFLQPDADAIDQSLYCAKPIMLVISDINPSYDSDQLPGSAFAASGWSGGQILGADTLNVQERLNEISGDVEGLHFIGQVDSIYDSSCSSKAVDGLGNVRGLCPEEPTKQGGYYAGAVAHYGRNTDLRPDLPGTQKVSTYSVALSSPLPEIEIPIGNQKVKIVPFGKTVYASGLDASKGKFQPTCTIVDFFVEEIAEDKSHGKFRINFEDVEQGADHDMDVIVLYEYWVQDDNTIKVKLTKEYQAAGYVMHLGYIISGTTKDGIYLEVASKPSNDITYFLDTPTDRTEPGRGSSTRLLSYGVLGDDTVYSRERTFTPGDDPSATLLKDPLWYAAKWGGDEDGREWDKDADGIPDTYFYVTNPLQLEKELNRVFASILEKAASGTSASVLATTSRGEGNILQAYFRPTIPNNDDVKWLGYLQNLWVDSKGNIRENTSGKNVDESYGLDIYQDKILVFETDETGDTIVKKFAVSENDPFPDIYTSTAYTSHNMNEILSIWEAGEKLMERDANNRKIYTFIGDINDSPNDPQVFGESDSEVIVFNTTNKTSIRPYLGVLCNAVDDDENCFYNYLGTNVTERAEKLIKFIRGEDLNGLRSRTIKDESGTEIGVWKLGDIINSSPAAVSRPPSNYHLIYGDKSYQDYYIANRNRETVVYVGANDGMLHAFTSWKYDSHNRKYTKPSGTTEDIGDEIWAYIPQSLLPHLKWLSDPDYSHVYYVDQMPLVADAKIGGTWKTLLIGGLRMGGKEIEVYEDFGNEIIENKTFYPTYFCIDITSPRNPKLLWERTYDNMGFSFSIPTIIREGEESSDNWYLVFGSGPTDYDGKSDQKGRVFVVDLATGAPFGAGENDLVFEGDDFAFFTSSTAMDKDLYVTDNKFSHEHVYLGQSYLYDNSWKGKIYRLDIKTGTPNYWDFNSVFSIDAPITASLALSVDKTANTWIFGGTGRYIEQADKDSNDDQYLFGFKDPLYNPGKDNSTKYDELSLYNLYRVDNLLVTTSKIILDSDSENVQSSATPTWNDLVGKTDVDYSNIGTPVYRDGWYRELLKPGERCITKPSVIGGLSLMPSFVPTDDICGFGGESYFYSLYYKTGTAYYNPTFRNEGTYKVGNYDVVLDEIPLGYGMPASHLGIHVGEQDGATALIQLGTGGIIKIDVDTAINIRSGILNWKEK